MLKVFFLDTCIKIIVFLSVNGIVPNVVIGLTVARGRDVGRMALITLILGPIIATL
jgi:hypothetical protein